MGYYTHHTLEVPYENEGLISVFREECEGAVYAIDDNGYCEESTKWYDHEKDLRKFSKKHPDVIFTLKGEGEESGDLWVEYYKAGKMQRCKAKIVYDDYDDSELE